MLSRTLTLAAVASLFGILIAAPALAQNLEAGKSPSQIFSGTCSLCHKSSRGMLKSVSSGSLPGFLRQHYTTSSDMASAMSAFVLSNGAADARIGGDSLTRQGREARSEPKPSITPSGTSDAKPDAAPKPRPTREASKPPDAEIVAAPQPAPDAAESADKPKSDAQQKSAKGNRGQKGLPKSAALREEPAKDETRPDAAKDLVRPDAITRTDPVPAVTPAPSAFAPAPGTPPPSDTTRTAQDLTPGSTVLTIDKSPPPLVVEAPSGPSRNPAGPPVPPISQ